MTKRFCDECGEERPIHGIQSLVTVGRQNDTWQFTIKAMKLTTATADPNPDLCDDCRNKLMLAAIEDYTNAQNSIKQYHTGTLKGLV